MSPNRAKTDQGRLADIGPSLAEFAETPLLGQGFGTRISDYAHEASAQILDDQWLKTLLEAGLVGAVSLFWLLALAIKRSFGRARRTVGIDGWRGVAFSASLLAYTVAMFVYDAFSFIQSTYLLFIILALRSSSTGDKSATLESTGAAASVAP